MFLYFIKNNYFRITFLGLIIMDSVFFFAHQYHLFGIIAFILIALSIVYLIVKDIKWAIYLSFLELFVGSQGGLISVNIFGFSLSLRMLIFIIAFIAGVVYLYKQTWLRQRGALATPRREKLDFIKSKYVWFYVLYILILIFSVLVALYNKTKLSNIFFDINNFLFFLILPIYYQIIKDKKVLINLFYIFLSASLFFSLKTIIVFYLFSQQFSSIDYTTLYKWLRDTRVGEITKMSDHFYRIFFQSQIYLMISFVISSVVLMTPKLQKKDKIFFYTLSILNLSAIIVSFSRSYWLGIVIAFIFLFFILLFQKQKIKIIFLNYIKLFGAIIFSILLIFVLLKIPNTHINFADMLSGRVSDGDVSSNSRMELLSPMIKDIKNSPIIGYGVGHEISYYSLDPRNKNALNPTGRTTTYSFEWGWLSFWLKMGIFGLIFYIALSLKIMRDSVRLIRANSVIFVSLLLSFLAVLVVHIFSPYLDHPLGIGFLILIICIIELADSRKLTAES